MTSDAPQNRSAKLYDNCVGDPPKCERDDLMRTACIAMLNEDNTPYVSANGPGMLVIGASVGQAPMPRRKPMVTTKAQRTTDLAGGKMSKISGVFTAANADAPTGRILHLFRSNDSPSQLETLQLKDTLETTLASMPDLEDRISTMQNELQALLGERSRKQGQIRDCRSLLDSIRRIPKEIFCEIFKSLLEQWYRMDPPVLGKPSFTMFEFAPNLRTLFGYPKWISHFNLAFSNITTFDSAGIAACTAYGYLLSLMPNLREIKIRCEVPMFHDDNPHPEVPAVISLPHLESGGLLGHRSKKQLHVTMRLGFLSLRLTFHCFLVSHWVWIDP
ncbi:hypothetical protein C8J56DRAFT_886997 [Mycena floridula]|nr:hypothetical protein C8J56DRAFT_886997 [Mycena floridula]